MSDILIRGMEMPEKGLEIEISKNWDGKIYARPKQPLYAKQKPSFDDWYEVIELPPHGRLGDLDELESGLRLCAKYQEGYRQQGILGACETIRLASTIIPADEEGEK